MEQTKRANTARYSKYVLLVCTYLNVNVNEKLVVITLRLAIWHHTSVVCCRGCNNLNTERVTA